MKCCNRCGEEIDTKDGDNTCPGGCKRRKDGRFKHARLRKSERESILRDLGLIKVRGALGGTYWE